MTDLTLLFATAVEKRASDLHIISGYEPTVRILGRLIRIRNAGTLTGKETEALLSSILTDQQKSELQENRELDFGYQWNTYRFRVNYYYAQGGLAAAFRLIPKRIPTIDELHLPNAFHKFTQLSDGFILFTGPTGEGKSTTIASLLQEINISQEQHIVTIEDPIEYVFESGRSIISQRELHSDTYSLKRALRAVLREDPNVVLVGEMRDFDTISSALTIAETGHLVFSTLHTSSTHEAINRIIDVFPAAQQNQIRSQLASVLKAVVTQHLLPSSDGKSLVPAVEVLINNSAVSALIRDAKTHMIDNVIETSEEEDMILLEKNLAKLYQTGVIAKETALAAAQRKTLIKKFIG
ncbi:PilT/PilU family type 4a pilus ATPase [Candidatus Woesebacteria bacterium]|nr:PilT/PilU family type 4a pilus ATPase [Candidatus Woesebacteria bacterium]